VLLRRHLNTRCTGIAANLMANRRIKGRRDSHDYESNEVAQADAEIAESLGLTEEQKAVIGDELTLTGLNFRVLRTKQVDSNMQWPTPSPERRECAQA
jgi:hypothetical protein